EKAEPLQLESKTIMEKTMGKEHPSYAQILIDLALLYGETGQYEKAESLYLEAQVIREKTLGKEHPDYAGCLNNLAILYWMMGQYEKAEPYYLESKNIREKTLGKEHPDYAKSLHNLSVLYGSMSHYEKAEPLQLESKVLIEKVYGKSHPEYVKGLDHMAALNWLTSDFDSVRSFFLEAEEIEKSYLVQATRFLSERELSAYVLKFAGKLDKRFSFAQVHTGISGACYNNTLFHKGFLINAVSQINKLALTDSASTEYYLRLKSLRRRLSIEYAKPTAERKNVAELEEKANTLEKELARSVAGFGEALRQVNWQEVQAALKPREAAIEFIRFSYYTPKPTDSVLYAALLLKPGTAAPAFIPLFEEKQLDALLTPLAGQGSGGPNELYGGKTGQSLYRLLWASLEPHLKGVKTVYFSPAGLLHRLNLGAIPTGKSKETIGKRHALSALGSTRQLVVTTAAPAANTAAVVFGGIRYDMDSAAIATGEPGEFAGHRGLSFSQTDSTLRSGTWKYLKYSEREADNIQAQLQQAGFQAGAHKGYAATEEAFKQLGKDRPSPRILHVSTHGFFFPDPESNLNSEIRNPQLSEPVFKISDHPMIRSGLILAGANHAWSTGKPLGNREDGILTAYEISQMDLRHTELVVLSACETGLGDIRGNEGVYGLQRAFKIAGVKNLIMSLWQVPDFQTQELMTVFYQKWLSDNMTVHQALKAAQEEMQRRRYEPFYWAGFVLVE
ncbi:MAG: CHAT domain-containing protein, partial [Thermoanaerobaculia bacterium]|nr:CHAT domain-containing protein [Thermoanaerobaculia bacterium]